MPIELQPEDRAALEAALRPATVEKRMLLRGQALLLMADGVPLVDIAKLLGVEDRTVRRWRNRFLAGAKALEMLADAPRSGRPPSLSPKRTRRGS